ncbi:MAG: glycosyltransferase family 4 protein [Acidobacteriota bacterium]
MRVIVVSNTYPPADISGVGTLVAELVAALDRAGHEARAVVRRAPPGDRRAIALGGRKLLFPLHAALAVRRLARCRPIDVVHVHESDGAAVVLLVRLARLLRRPLGRARIVATLQVSYRRERRAVRPVRAGGRVVSRPTAAERGFAWLRAPVHAVLGRLTARLADAVVAPSRATARELEADYGARNVEVIANGIAAPPASPARRAAGADATVLFVGRLRTRKAVAVLLQAFARVAAAEPGARLVVLGDGEQRQALAAQLRALGLGERVRLAGAVPRSEIADWLARADVFCLPSTYEGFPLAILEAMAADLPVVATRVAGVPEAVEDGASGLLVEPEDDAGLAAALSALIRDPARRHALGERGRALLAERFAIGDVCRRYVELFERVATSRRADAALS